MNIITYNVNGIRAAMKKGFSEWLKSTNADMICLQEVKAEEHQVELEAIKDQGFEIYWMPAVKKGYSGVAIFTKIPPKNIGYGCGMDIYDNEGRVVTLDFDEFSLMSVYMPSGSSGDIRQEFKMQWLDDFYHYIQDVKKERPNLIISGDYNICHKPIDIHNPVTNKNSSGFLPEEREWVTKFISSGFVDAFRAVNPDPDEYTWWTYRFGARRKNLGWRIDYHMVSDPIRERIKNVRHLYDAEHSDHCPVFMQFE